MFPLGLYEAGLDHAYHDHAGRHRRGVKGGQAGEEPTGAFGQNQ